METSHTTWASLPSHWPSELDVLTWCHEMNGGTAALLVMGGIVYLLFGFYAFKYLIMANAAAMGGYLGALIGQRCGEGVVGALLGGFMAAALTWPTMKYSVAVMGGILGGAFGASVWNSVGLEPRFAWAGALSGLIAFGMLSFILFRGSIMMYMSLQGSVMLIFGILGLVYKYESVRPSVHQHMIGHSFLLPMSILVATILGWIYQHHSTGPAMEAPKKK